MSKSFKGDKTMARLTKDQKIKIDVLCIYEADARVELHTNGRTERYDSLVWMVVYYRKMLGLKVAEHEQMAADRDEAIREAA